MVSIDSTPEFVLAAYQKMEKNLEIVRGRLNRPMTLAEKLMFSHLDDPEGAELIPAFFYIHYFQKLFFLIFYDLVF